jgi:hypothetical protein
MRTVNEQGKEPFRHFFDFSADQSKIAEKNLPEPVFANALDGLEYGRRLQRTTMPI